MRLIVASNRLPVTVQDDNGNYRFDRSIGGVATGLSTFLHLIPSSTTIQDYLWIGWPGTTIPEDDQPEMKQILREEYHAQPVFLSEEQMENFYHGFCNKTIWALFHYFPSFAIYDEQYWQDYISVNEAFCNSLMEVIQPGDIVWVHDYHLMLLPGMLKERAPHNPVGFFLHIPFPNFEIFRLLPSAWRTKIIEGLLGADLIGFHTHDYVQYFIRCVQSIGGYESQKAEIYVGDRIVLTDSFPMGIDFQHFNNSSEEPGIQSRIEQLRKSFREKQLILSVDRLDYSKGIAQRLRSYQVFLEEHPEWCGKVALLLVVVPSRVGVQRYQLMKKEIDELVGSINGRFGRIRWMPILYQFKALPFEELAAIYAASDVILVTPLRDGMNLIAKEYVASRRDGSGVLILSEMAGSAKELTQAIIINPNTPGEVSNAIATALTMPLHEQKKRNSIMQQRLKRYDVVQWANDFIRALIRAKETQTNAYARLLDAEQQGELVRRYQMAKKRILFLDYDGTLVPFIGNPELAAPDLGLEEALTRLSMDADVVIISGRDRATMDQWFGDLPVGMVAEHGVWTKGRGEDWRMLKPLDCDWKQEVLPIFEFFADRLPGSFVEEKQCSIAFHYREADPQLSDSRLRHLISDLEHLTPKLGLHALQGNKVLEVRMAGVEKGIAASRFLSRDQYSFRLAIGDDWTDEDLFRVLPEGSDSIKVGPGSSSAKFHLYSYRDVRNLLNLLASSIRYSEREV